MIRRSIGGTLAATFAVLCAGAPAAAQARPDTTTVVVTITASRVGVSQQSIAAGSVLFKVVNKDLAARSFSVAGKRTAPIAPGKAGTLRVVFTKSGSYGFVSSGRGKALKGTLKVTTPAAAPAPSAGAPAASSSSTGSSATATCVHPTATTVTVMMRDGSFTFSQTMIPCGPVTFVTTNVGSLEHSLVFGGGGARSGVNPGLTAQFTVNLAPGDLQWQCGTFGHDDLGEEGTLVIF